MGRLTRLIWRNPAVRVAIVLALATAGVSVAAVAGWAAEPQPWEIGMQPSATPVHDRMTFFHNDILMPIISVITVFVLGLLVYAMYRFSAKRHPIPTRTSHNALIEVLWTIIPVLILVLIAIPSFKLMYYEAEVPDSAMTIKVTGHQWYWSYEYPDQKIGFDSNFVADKDLKPGMRRLLEVDNPLVVPAGTNVRVLVSSTDVIHSWFISSFGVQEYAVIGRANESWFNVEKPGTYYGECNQICGINHSRMPIKVVALSKADFDKWLGEAKKKFALAPPDKDKPTQVAATAAAAVGGAPQAGN